MHVHNLQHPTHCFCEISESEMRRWITKRFRQKKSTMELLQEARSDHEREIVSIIALLDVDDDTLLSIMDQVEMPNHHILNCRKRVQQMVARDKERAKTNTLL